MRALFILMVAIGLSAFVTYASSMLVLVLGLMEYVNEIMFGIFVVVVFGFGLIPYTGTNTKHYHKEKLPHSKRRDYFKERNLFL